MNGEQVAKWLEEKSDAHRREATEIIKAARGGWRDAHALAEARAIECDALADKARHEWPTPTEQPAPKPKGPEVYPVAMATLEAYECFSGVSTFKMRRLLDERRDVGLSRYGVMLHRDDGRDARKDAVDEVGDLYVYGIRLKMKGDNEGLRGVAEMVAQVYTVFTLLLGGELMDDVEGYEDE